MRAIALVGPECTGKTTLARALAGTFDAELSPEGARIYVERMIADGDARTLGPKDVEPIARLQLAGERAAEARASRSGRGYVVRDTDLVSTVVYARLYYGACPAWIAEAARARRAELYLLCDVDAPWSADGVRDAAFAGAAVRAAVRNAFAAVLADLACDVVVISGGWDARERAAIAAARSRLCAR